MSFHLLIRESELNTKETELFPSPTRFSPLLLPSESQMEGSEGQGESGSIVMMKDARLVQEWYLEVAGSRGKSQ